MTDSGTYWRAEHALINTLVRKEEDNAFSVSFGGLGGGGGGGGVGGWRGGEGQQSSYLYEAATACVEPTCSETREVQA